MVSIDRFTMQGVLVKVAYNNDDTPIIRAIHLHAGVTAR